MCIRDSLRSLYSDNYYESMTVRSKTLPTSEPATPDGASAQQFESNAMLIFKFPYVSEDVFNLSLPEYCGVTDGHLVITFSGPL